MWRRGLRRWCIACLRVEGKAEVLFKTADQHIRCLLMAAGWNAVGGERWGGRDLQDLRPGRRGRSRLRCMRRRGGRLRRWRWMRRGMCMRRAWGRRDASTLPPLPVTGNVGVTITFSQPGSSTAAGANTLVPDGSEIYRIAADGSPQKLVTLKDDVVYALAVRNGSLLAATGNRGRVYRVDTKVAGRFTDVAHLEAAQGMAFAAVKDGLLVATSNSGKVFRLGDAVAANATYTSEVFDAQGFSQWGRAEVRRERRQGLICMCGAEMWRVR